MELRHTPRYEPNRERALLLLCSPEAPLPSTTQKLWHATLGQTAPSTVLPHDAARIFFGVHGMVVAVPLPQERTAAAMDRLITQAMDLCRMSPAAELVLHPGLFAEAGFAPSTFPLAAAAGLLCGYRFSLAASEASEPLPDLVLITTQPEDVRWAESIARGVALARDLGNTPANLLCPATLADAAAAVAQQAGWTAQILEGDALASWGCLAAVAGASRVPPRVVVLDSAPHSDQPPLVLVGKGITFDSGGICLKPAGHMHEMKADMAGAAAILGAIAAIHGLGGPCRRTLAILPLAENLPGSGAMRPGDVITARSGLRVEVQNTDAEGRLILADALHLAGEFQPCAIVDVATLTGACVVALGTRIAGLFASSTTIQERVLRLGQSLGETFWPMPLADLYAKDLKSEVADLKNIAHREGGALYAALFLRHFVPQGVPWAHLDIAGPAWSNDKVSLVQTGATGFGVRTLTGLMQEEW